MVGPGAACEGSKLVPLTLSGTAGFGSYKRAGERRWEPWSVQVIEVADGRIVGHHNFLHPEWFEQLGLPAHLEG